MAGHMALRVEPFEDVMQAGCPCCSEGGARGFVYEDEEPHSVYFAESGGMGARPVVLVGVASGRWARDARADERVCIVFACSRGPEGLEARPTIPYLLAYPEFKELGAPIEPEGAEKHPWFGALRTVLGEVIAQDHRFAHLRDQGGERRSRFVAD